MSREVTRRRASLIHPTLHLNSGLSTASRSNVTTAVARLIITTSRPKPQHSPPIMWSSQRPRCRQTRERSSLPQLYVQHTHVLGEGADAIEDRTCIHPERPRHSCSRKACHHAGPSRGCVFFPSDHLLGLANADLQLVPPLGSITKPR